MITGHASLITLRGTAIQISLQNHLRRDLVNVAARVPSFLAGVTQCSVGCDCREPLVPSDDGAGEDDEEGAGRSDEDILTELGEAWVASREPMAKKEFVAEAEALVKDGQAGLVLEVCQRLIGKANETGMVDELKEIIDKAWRQEPPRPGLKGWLSRIIPGARPET